MRITCKNLNEGLENKYFSIFSKNLNESEEEYQVIQVVVDMTRCKFLFDTADKQCTGSFSKCKNYFDLIYSIISKEGKILRKSDTEFTSERVVNRTATVLHSFYFLLPLSESIRLDDLDKKYFLLPERFKAINYFSDSHDVTELCTGSLEICKRRLDGYYEYHTERSVPTKYVGEYSYYYYFPSSTPSLDDWCVYTILPYDEEVKFIPPEELKPLNYNEDNSSNFKAPKVSEPEEEIPQFNSDTKSFFGDNFDDEFAGLDDEAFDAKWKELYGESLVKESSLERPRAPKITRHQTIEDIPINNEEPLPGHIFSGAYVPEYTDDGIPVIPKCWWDDR